MRNDRAGDRHGAEQIDLELTPHGGVGEGLEEAQFRIAGVVDQHIDRAEPFEGLGDDGARGLGVCDIQRQDVQAIRIVHEGVAHRFGGPRRRDHRLAGVERGARDLAPQPSARARHQPNLAHRLLLDPRHRSHLSRRINLSE